MTYKAIKEEVVKVQQRMKQKSLNKFLTRLGLFVGCFGLCIVYLTSKLLGSVLAALEVFLLLLGFLYAVEVFTYDETLATKLQKIVRLWFLGIPLFLYLYIFVR